MLENRGFAFHPDLVLLAWHQSDYDDNVRSQLFALSDGKLVRDQKEYLPGVKTRQMLDRIPGYSWIEANSMLYSFVRETIAKKVKSILAAVHGGSDAPAASAEDGGSASEAQPAAAPTAEPTYSDRLTVALLAKIQEECQQKGIKLLILDVPTWTSRTRFLSQFPHAAAEGVVKLDVVSPLDTFKPHLGEKLFWERGHFHFTVLGCRLVGEVLSDHILREKLLDANSPSTSR
jgi:hypothetical protein